MKNQTFTREYYVEMWKEILSTYQWWGHDLISLLDEIVNDKIRMYKKWNLKMYKNVQIKIP